MAFSSDDFPHPEGPEILAISPPFQLQVETREKYIVAVGDTGIFYLQHGVPLIFLYRKDSAKKIFVLSLTH